MEARKNSEKHAFKFDKTSNVWLEPFSVLIGCVFPFEYVHVDWLYWQDKHLLQNDNSSDNKVLVGSRAEGFCIPQLHLAVSNITNPYLEKKYWEPDEDVMIINENSNVLPVPDFNIEPLPEDPRYVKLRLRNEWKINNPKFMNSAFLDHWYILSSYSQAKNLNHAFKSSDFSDDIHGPVRKICLEGIISMEIDNCKVFKYCFQTWPESAMEWLSRSRKNKWPPPDIIEEIYKNGCHLAPVGRRKRKTGLNLDLKVEDEIFMDETEWRISFSIAENKLGQIMTPVQRHVIVFLKIIKKLYFPKIISSYYLKNILFWECENRENAFWNESNTALCFTVVMDHLLSCLERHCLPHYFICQSNLLKYDKVDEIDEAAVIVADVRKNILLKTVTSVVALYFDHYLSSVFLQNLELGSYIFKVQNETLDENDINRYMTYLLKMFTEKYKQMLLYIGLLKNGEKDEAILIDLLIMQCVYECLLARNLCKLWQITNDGDDNGSDLDVFLFFLIAETNGVVSISSAFRSVALTFFQQLKDGREPILVAPISKLMKLTKRLVQKKVQREYEIIENNNKDIVLLNHCEHQAINKKLDEQKEQHGRVLTMEEIRHTYDEEMSWLYKQKHGVAYH